MVDLSAPREGLAKRVALFARIVSVFILSAIGLLTLAAMPAILLVAWFLISGYINNPKTKSSPTVTRQGRTMYIGASGACPGKGSAAETTLSHCN